MLLSRVLYVPQCYSLNLPHLPLPTVSTWLFSTSLSLFLPCKYVHLYHFSRFNTYVLIYNVYFSISDFTLYDRL